MKAFTKIIRNLACSLRARPVQRGLTRYPGSGSLWGARKLQRQQRRQAGFALIEMLVAASLLGTIAVTALLGLSTGILATSVVTNGRIAMDIAQSQMEAVKIEPFDDTAPFEYTTLPDAELPDGWDQSQIGIVVTSESADLQLIEVTVTYANGTKSVVLEGYKSSR